MRSLAGIVVRLFSSYTGANSGDRETPLTQGTISRSVNVSLVQRQGLLARESTTVLGEEGPGPSLPCGA